MFLKTEVEESILVRKSKLGKSHKYKRKKTLAVFLCDACDELFKRELKKMQRKRLSNNYFHCCSNCDSKKFAQKKGAERKKIWDMPAGLDWPVGKH